MVEKQRYRDAMARLGAAVNVVTSDGPAGRGGFTASAVCSVTDDPPTLLVCVNRDTRNNEIITANGVLCVNVLAAGHESQALRFAGHEADLDRRFDEAEWSVLTTGSPVLEGATVSFDCRIAQVTEVGTHSVLFCAVDALRAGERHDALIYFGRAFHPVSVAAG